MSKFVAGFMLFLGLGCISAGYISKDPNESNTLMTVGGGISGGSTIALVSALNEDKKLKYAKDNDSSSAHNINITNSIVFLEDSGNNTLGNLYIEPSKESFNREEENSDQLSTTRSAQANQIESSKITKAALPEGKERTPVDIKPRPTAEPMELQEENHDEDIN